MIGEPIVYVLLDAVVRAGIAARSSTAMRAHFVHVAPPLRIFVADPGRNFIACAIPPAAFAGSFIVTRTLTAVVPLLFEIPGSIALFAGRAAPEALVGPETHVSLVRLAPDVAAVRTDTPVALAVVPFVVSTPPAALGSEFMCGTVTAAAA
jgi:hypothetical protein